MTVAIQINGRMRGRVTVETDASEDTVVTAALGDPAVSRHLDGKDIRKKIYVKNKILNLVV